MSFWLKSVREKRAAAERNVAATNLRLIGLGMMTYESKHGQFPLTATYDSHGKPLLSWRVELLPYIGL